MPHFFFRFIFLYALALVSCTKGDGPSSQFYLPWPSSSGEDRMQVVTIPSLNSPYEVSGPAAQVYLQRAIEPGGYSGDPMRPHLSRVDDVFYPLDVNSSMGLAVYAHMERIRALDVQMGVDNQVSWPRQVGIEVLLQKIDSRSLEYDNARYFMDWDVTAFLPMAQTKTPLAINPGIIAHEHFHAHFHNIVSKVVGIAVDPTEVELFNEQVVLRGWNEGLADYYGFVYSQNENFLESSLGADVGHLRKLKPTEEPLRIRSARMHYGLFQWLRTSGVDSSGMSYSIGTDVARVLVKIVSTATEVDPLPDHVTMLRHVLTRLPKIADLYKAQRSLNPIEPAEIMRLLFLQGAPILSLAQCQVIQESAKSLFEGLGLEELCLQ